MSLSHMILKICGELDESMYLTSDYHVWLSNNQVKVMLDFRRLEQADVDKIKTEMKSLG